MPFWELVHVVHVVHVRKLTLRPQGAQLADVENPKHSPGLKYTSPQNFSIGSKRPANYQWNSLNRSPKRQITHVLHKRVDAYSS